MTYEKTADCPNPACHTPSSSKHLLSDRGLTMVELLVVVVILGVLTIMALPAYHEVKKITLNARAITEIREIEKSLIAFSIDRGGAFPNALSEVGFGDTRDPWGHLYEYRPVRHRTDFLGILINADFDLYSMGPNANAPDSIDDPLSSDDIIRAGDGGFVGTVYDYYHP